MKRYRLLILSVITILLFSCNKSNEEEIPNIEFQKVVINNVGEFDYHDSLVYAGVNALKYQIKITRSVEISDFYYSTGTNEFKLLDSEWITIDSTMSQLSFYSSKEGFKQSEIKHIEFAFKNDSLINDISVSPNPTTSIFNIILNGKTRGELSCDIYNRFGLRAKSNKIFVSSDSFVFSNDLSDLANGVYFLRFKYGKAEKVLWIRKE